MEEDKSEIFSLCAEAGEQFAAQFDPDSDTFHRGDPRPVPIGGDRVPESMPFAYNTSGAIRDTPMDPTYYYFIEARSILVEFKKLLTQICPCVEGILRAHKIKDPQRLNITLNQRRGQLFELLEKAQIMNSQLTSFGDCVPNYSEMLRDVFIRSTSEYVDKQSFVEFTSFMTMCTQKVFKDSQMLMQKLKTIN